MKQVAIDSCKIEAEKLAVKEMTLEKLHDFGVLCRVGRNPYPAHCFNLLTDNTNKAAKIQCALFKGTTRDIFIDRKEFDGPIYEQVDDAYNFVLRHIDMGAEIEGVYRKDDYELPISAIREIIANAVLHRSYLDKSCVQVCIYDDRLEVSSPGMLYGGLDIETAKKGKSSCRNVAIAEPLFEEFGDGFKVTLFRKVSNTQGKVISIVQNISNALAEVSNATENVINSAHKESNTFEKYAPLFREAGITDKFISNIKIVYDKCGVGVPFGQANIQEWLGCSKSKATNVMNALKKAKVIEKVTGYGSGRYEFIEL